MTYIKEHKEVFATLLSHVDTFRFEEVYKRMFENIFNPILDRFHYSVEKRKYVMTYYLNGINAVILEWLKNDCRMSIEEISDIISICIYGFKNQKKQIRAKD